MLLFFALLSQEVLHKCFHFRTTSWKVLFGRKNYFYFKRQLIEISFCPFVYFFQWVCLGHGCDVAFQGLSPLQRLHLYRPPLHPFSQRSSQVSSRHQQPWWWHRLPCRTLPQHWCPRPLHRVPQKVLEKQVKEVHVLGLRDDVPATCVFLVRRRRSLANLHRVGMYEQRSFSSCRIRIE